MVVNRGRDGHSTDALTKREREVAGLVGAGLTTPEIAERLQLSPRTVYFYVRCVMLKLGVHRRAHLAHWAIQAGLAKLRRDRA